MEDLQRLEINKIFNKTRVSLVFPKVHLLFFSESFRLITTSFQSIGINFFPVSAFSLFYEFPNESKMFFIWNQQFWISINLIIIYGLHMIRRRKFSPTFINQVKGKKKKKVTRRIKRYLKFSKTWNRQIL